MRYTNFVGRSERPPIPVKVKHVRYNTNLKLANSELHLIVPFMDEQIARKNSIFLLEKLDYDFFKRKLSLRSNLYSLLHHWFLVDTTSSDAGPTKMESEKTLWHFGVQKK